jgi:small subunit ribosomal protein S16
MPRLKINAATHFFYDAIIFYNAEKKRRTDNMSVTIRLARHGAKKKPFYRVVAADRKFPRNGRFLEILGTYNPIPDPPEINIDMDRVESWIKKGASPSDTVRSLLKQNALSA